MAEEKGISNIITVTGGLFGDDKWNTYRESDVFVYQPSMKILE